MAFPTSAYLNLLFLFCGAAFGSLACVVFATFFKKKYFRFRLSLIFLLLAFAIVFAVLMVLEVKSAEAGKIILSNIKARFGALFVYFVLGGLCASFLRTVLPVLAVLYITFTFCFANVLYKQLPQPESLTLTVSENFVRDESNGQEYKFGGAAHGRENDGALCDLLFYVYELNENTLFPLPHIWYRLGGAILPTGGKLPDDVELLSVFDKKNSVFFKVFNSILGRPRVELVEVPCQQVYPSLYNIKIQNEGSKFNAALEKIM